MFEVVELSPLPAHSVIGLALAVEAFRRVLDDLTVEVCILADETRESASKTVVRAADPRFLGPIIRE